MNIPSPFHGEPTSGTVDPRYVGAEGESARRAVLAEYDFEGMRDDVELSRITDFAAKLCGTQTCLVSLVGSEEQHFVARTGLDALCTPRGQSFCQHAMVKPRIMVVKDARQDPRFVANTLVTGPPHIRFYAGAPLISEEGAPLGALCVIDPEARAEGLDELQREGLQVLAYAVMRRLAARRRKAEIEATTDAARDAVAESERRFEMLADAIPQMAWSTDGNGIPDYFNARWYEFTGTQGDEHFKESWVELLHPDDRERAAEVWGHSVESGEPYEVEYRLLRADGEYRWTLARGLPIKDKTGKIVRWFGSNTDIHDTKQLVEREQLLSRELTHRIKNIFSVVSGLVSHASRERPELRDVAGALTDRIAALGRAHNYVRPVSDEPASETMLSNLLEDLFAPYAQDGAARIEVVGDDLKVGEQAVTPLALTFHEIATNAVKYGALSVPEGKVKLTIRQDDDCVNLSWHEFDGPQIKADAERGDRGFGSDLVALSVERQLKGRLDYDWQDRGVCITVEVPIQQIVAY
ncbi:PAS domain-containing protein [Sphingomicrobium clamense]|uniref:histidine kinase n=1 Tax=Sphingomicrobium clamense TaxID=2851013 RepID=A0ABS6V7F1_9SPHN|nr:PAS domain-containing protein [Sphingomicrobium sp. B8]MBW0145498.1 PAS domain-containing protein [Sphingomicrobium sp. B8]